MKKILILSVLTVFITVTAVGMPLIVSAGLPRVSVVRMEKTAYLDTITVSGKIEETEKSEIKMDVPVVPKEVHVSLGDQVQVGDVIADIDVEKTKKAVISMVNAYDIIPEALLGLLSSASLSQISQEKISELIPSKITADYTGVVSSLTLKKGGVTSPSETVATISNLGQLQAVVRVPETYGNKIKIGQSVSIEASAVPGEVFSGTISSIAVVAHEELIGTSKQTVMNVYVDLDQQSKQLKSGYSITATVTTGGQKEMMTLPYEAINQDDTGREYVYLYQNGQAVTRSIVSGQEMSHCVEVMAGLNPEEWVIYENNMIKRDQQYVNVKEKRNA